MARHRAYVGSKEYPPVRGRKLQNLRILHSIRDHPGSRAIVECGFTALQTAADVWIQICVGLKAELHADFRKSSRAR